MPRGKLLLMAVILSVFLVALVTSIEKRRTHTNIKQSVFSRCIDYINLSTVDEGLNCENIAEQLANEYTK